MAGADHHHPLIFTFGILGNIISILMFLAPMPTFIRVYKKKSTEGFHSIPYLVGLFSCMLWIYYAMLKSEEYLLLSINSVGCLVEIIYIICYILYAPKKPKILALQLLFLMNFCGFLAIVALTTFFAKGSIRIHIVGWFCVVVSAVLFAAPLSVIRVVIRTKSVQFMPLALSICLTLSAIMWLLYGLLQKDLYIALPNIFGIIFGAMQLVLYGIYRDKKKIVKEENVAEKAEEMNKAHTVVSVLPICNGNINKVHKEENSDEDTNGNGELPIDEVTLV
ncbi:bidirectional sugar transporter N3-like [Mercurialis annua]|uniref:bidirectional sugar transporter N3-like n=1 Tax=Mercurialis annua TaxID=3986 RepID=UPI00215E8F07|nr:bidirectional sugar transporter N3-like [Mercurialis annua]